jgi:hypothetical protein
MLLCNYEEDKNKAPMMMNKPYNIQNTNICNGIFHISFFKALLINESETTQDERESGRNDSRGEQDSGRNDSVPFGIDANLLFFCSPLKLSQSSSKFHVWLHVTRNLVIIGLWPVMQYGRCCDNQNLIERKFIMKDGQKVKIGVNMFLINLYQP